MFSVRYLVEKGADMELANRHGHTPLMIGAFRKKSQVVEYLLSKGASPLKSSYKVLSHDGINWNMFCWQGNTALHDAAESDCIVVCKLLIEAGASLVEDDCGLCPLMGAAVMANMAVFPFLVAHSVSKRRIKDAYRLLGCTLVDKKMDLEGAVKMWNSAIDIQLNDEEMEMERTRRMDGASHHVFKAFPEVITKDQLELIKDDPDKIRMQVSL